MLKKTAAEKEQITNPQRAKGVASEIELFNYGVGKEFTKVTHIS